MTPTEQDKELDRYAMSIVHMVGSIQHEKLPETITSSAFVDLRQASNDEAIDAIKQLITADRKRVALEARIDELENRLRVQFIPSHWERLRTEVNSWAKYVDRRIAELKAQQEEV